MYSTAGGDIAEHSSILNAGNKLSQLSSQQSCGSATEQPTYAAVDKSKKKKLKKQTEKEHPKCEADKKGPPVSPYSGNEASMQEKKENATKQEINSPHTIEQLYTAVQKKPKKGSKADNKAPPPHTVEEMQIAGEKSSQNTTEDLYTAVMKKPKDSLRDDAETAPPIPPHTVEELYTAVMKTPKSGTEDGEEAPPIPLYTVKEN
jgi:hypothetical protein